MTHNYEDSERYGFQANSDEPTIESFLNDSDAAEPFLRTYAGPGTLRYRTYPKLEHTFSEVWANYIGHLTSLFHLQPTLSDLVIDIGAHHGFFALNYAYASGARVLAVEPNPINLAILGHNLKLNPELKIEKIAAAASAVEGIATFNFGKTSTTGALHSSLRDWKRTLSDLDVRTVSLEGIVARSEGSRIRVLKCDCEGGEYDFLMKTSHEALERIDYLALEVHPTIVHQPSELESFLRQRGWDVHSFPGAMGTAVQGCIDLFAANSKIR